MTSVIRWSILLAKVLLALAVSFRAAAEDLSAVRLGAVYHGASRVSAEVVQTKESRYLAKPLKSTVRLVYTPEKITWETLTPVASMVMIDREGLKVVGGDGVARAQPGASESPRVGAIVGFVRALVAVDLAALEKDFVLTFAPDRVQAVAKPSSPLAFLKKVEMLFSSDLRLKTLRIDGDSEKTVLDFHGVVIVRSPSAASTSPATGKQ